MNVNTFIEKSTPRKKQKTNNFPFSTSPPYAGTSPFTPPNTSSTKNTNTTPNPTSPNANSPKHAYKSPDEVYQKGKGGEFGEM